MAKKQKKGKEKTSRKLSFNLNLLKSGIGRKILIMTISIMLVMLAMTVFLAYRTASYNEQYAASINNLTKINYIKNHIEQISDNINVAKLRKKHLDDVNSGTYLTRMLEYINSVTEEIPSNGIYDTNKTYASTIVTTLSAYKDLYDQI